MNQRSVLHVIRGVPAFDGAGVRLSRIIGSPQCSELDPFLLLDEIRAGDASEAGAGFPDHPHRGFETVTYMLAGSIRHEDNRGHAGMVAAGGVQWMTAGRGIVHSEMPEADSGALWGFQLWINLPAAHKMAPPRYQEFGADQLGLERKNGSALRVIAGRSDAGTIGPVRAGFTEPRYFDVQLDPGAPFTQSTSVDDNALFYVYRGAVAVNGDAVTRGSAAVLDRGDSVALRAGGDGAGLLFLSARPLREPIARYGPFVMNTQAELETALRDYQLDRF